MVHPEEVEGTNCTCALSELDRAVDQRTMDRLGGLYMPSRPSSLITMPKGDRIASASVWTQLRAVFILRVRVIALHVQALCTGRLGALRWLGQGLGHVV